MRSAPPPGTNDEPWLAKQTALMALVLASLIVGGFFMVAVSLKFNGYPQNDWVRWNALPVFLRHHGFHLLWLPVIWTCVAVAAQRRDRGNFYSGVFWSGLILAVCLVGMYFVAAFAPYTRSFIIKRRPAADAQSITAPPAKSPAATETDHSSRSP